MRSKEWVKPFTIAVPILLFAFVLWRIDDAIGILRAAWGIISPFAMGFLLAFVINQPMRFMEKHLTFLNKTEVLRKLRRTLCLLLSVVLILGVITLVVMTVLPEIYAALEKIAGAVPGLLTQVDNLLVQHFELSLRDVLGFSPSSTPQNLQDQLKGWANIVLGGVTYSSSIVFSFGSSIANFVIALVFAVYALYSKERVCSQFKRLSKAYLKKKWDEKLLAFGQLSEKTFSSFISGQCLESLVSGLLVYLALLVFRIPYALLIGMLVFIGAFIPIFGAYIAAALGALMVLLADPSRVVWFLVIYLVVQQLDGNLVYPRIMGNSIGLPSMWVLVAVTVGGGLFGILGMLLFIPVASIIYQIVKKDANKRLDEKKKAEAALSSVQ